MLLSALEGKCSRFFGYSFELNTRKEQVSVTNIKPFQLLKDDHVAIEDVPVTGQF